MLDVITSLRVGHLVLLALGLGGALMLDLLSCRFFMNAPITPASFAIMEFGSSVVAFALAGLWLTGLAFLTHDWLFDAAKLANPKIWAKLSIVAVLSLNGWFIHSTVLPFVRSQVGRSLFAGTTAAQRAVLLTTAAISCISWLFPIVLGAIRSWHPADTFLAGYLVFAVPYLVALTLGVIGAQVAARIYPLATRAQGALSRA